MAQAETTNTGNDINITGHFINEAPSIFCRWSKLRRSFSVVVWSICQTITRCVKQSTLSFLLLPPSSCLLILWFIQLTELWWHSASGECTICNICIPVVSTAFCSRLRSASRNDIVVSLSWTAHYGLSSFRAAAPQIWNVLPDHLNNRNTSHQQFTSGLNTRLFEQAYLQEAAFVEAFYTYIKFD